MEGIGGSVKEGNGLGKDTECVIDGCVEGVLVILAGVVEGKAFAVGTRVLNFSGTGYVGWAGDPIDANTKDDTVGCFSVADIRLASRETVVVFPGDVVGFARSLSWRGGHGWICSVVGGGTVR